MGLASWILQALEIGWYQVVCEEPFQSAVSGVELVYTFGPLREEELNMNTL